ncbi:hypothetical protein Tcan_00533, partial [Toxocara canis]
MKHFEVRNHQVCVSRRIFLTWLSMTTMVEMLTFVHARRECVFVCKRHMARCCAVAFVVIGLNPSVHFTLCIMFARHGTLSLIQQYVLYFQMRSTKQTIEIALNCVRIKAL